MTESTFKRPSVSASPCAVAMVCSTRALFILWNRCFPQSSRRWQLLLLTLSLSISCFLSTFFALWHFRRWVLSSHFLLSSSLPFSTSSFDLGCACVCSSSELSWHSSEAGFNVLPSCRGGTSGFEYKFLYFVQYPVKEQVLETILFCLKKYFVLCIYQLDMHMLFLTNYINEKDVFLVFLLFFSVLKEQLYFKLWSDFFIIIIDQNAIFVWGLMWCLCVLERVSVHRSARLSTADPANI